MGFAQNLSRMFKEEIWSSELETGLSSFEQDGAPEVSSSRVPFKALGVLCTLKEKDELELGIDFNFLPSLRLGSLMLMIELVLIFLTKFASTRLTSLVGFTSLFTLSLGNCFFI